MAETTNNALTNDRLVAFCKAMLGQPYWYGTAVYKCTNSLLTRKTKQYPSHYWLKPHCTVQAEHRQKTGLCGLHRSDKGICLD